MEEVKDSTYKNPLMETYEVDGQMDIFAFIPQEKKNEFRKKHELQKEAQEKRNFKG